jgi:hypothetical protein
VYILEEAFWDALLPHIIAMHARCDPVGRMMSAVASQWNEMTHFPSSAFADLSITGERELNPTIKAVTLSLVKNIIQLVIRVRHCNSFLDGLELQPSKSLV